jgi:malate dehydrogenase (oxaloacetate-decarboxylating)(NADP+)
MYKAKASRLTWLAKPGYARKALSSEPKTKAGAAALACLKLLVDLGMRVENIWVTDLAGVVYRGRKELMDPDKDVFAKDTDARKLIDVIGDADILLGLSAGGVVSQEMIKKMAQNPLVFVLANPTPEIHPAEVKEVRPDAIIATGRTDYPNQVNSVLRQYPYWT